MTASVDAWLARLERQAPDVVAAWRAMPAMDERGLSALRSLRRELRTRVGPGSADEILAQQEAVGDELGAVLASLPDELLRAPGGEEDWNVAQAFAHATAARRFLAAWAALDAAGEWPEHRPPMVRPSVPGPPDASREQLMMLLDKSRRSLRESAARIAGHETDRCRLEHPIIGRLRCGEWLLFVGVHDLMHLEQLHRLASAASAHAPA
ncbi:MAG TPA: DinB family protein [Candidatus Limnocylindria bacterium]|nr:DinB family protein [Candidatus Limnocylindria bacterium]